VMSLCSAIISLEHREIIFGGFVSSFLSYRIFLIIRLDDLFDVIFFLQNESLG